METDAILQILFQTLGGLGIFLIGMKYMSDGLQAIAGSGLRKAISTATHNRFFAVGLGTGVTCLVQSSSITTVIVVGLVNSGFMQLTEAIGVVMGANIGTTITGWILGLPIAKYGLPILGAAAISYLFSRRDRWRYFSMACLGIGMIFFGLELMSSGVKPIRSMPAFIEWFHTFRADDYFGVLKAALLGCILTVIVQSSSATLGITIALASQGVIEFETAAALVLGENIGTTITALLASLGATTTNAKRAAYAHVLFNVLGVLWITAIFPFYMTGVYWVLNSIFQIDPTLVGPIAADGHPTYPNAVHGIATVHTGFNVANTIIFLPLIGVMAKFLHRVVPDKPHKEAHHLTHLDVGMLETPVLAIEESRVEIQKMGEGTVKMMDWLKVLLQQDIPDEKLTKKLFHREEVLDNVQTEVATFMTDLLAAEVPHSISEEGRRQLRIADEFESVSDAVVAVMKAHLKINKVGLKLDPDEFEELMNLHDKTFNYLQMIYTAVKQQNREVVTKAHSEGAAVTRLVKDSRDKHLAKLSEMKVDPRVNLSFISMLNGYRSIKDHAQNIAEAMSGPK